MKRWRGCRRDVSNRTTPINIGQILKFKLSPSLLDFFLQGSFLQLISLTMTLKKFEDARLLGQGQNVRHRFPSESGASKIFLEDCKLYILHFFGFSLVSKAIKHIPFEYHRDPLVQHIFSKMSTIYLTQEFIENNSLSIQAIVESACSGTSSTTHSSELSLQTFTL